MTRHESCHMTLEREPLPYVEWQSNTRGHRYRFCEVHPLRVCVGVIATPSGLFPPAQKYCKRCGKGDRRYLGHPCLEKKLLELPFAIRFLLFNLRKGTSTAPSAHMDETPSSAAAVVYDAQSSSVSMASRSVSCTLSLPVQYRLTHVPG